MEAGGRGSLEVVALRWTPPCPWPACDGNDDDRNDFTDDDSDGDSDDDFDGDSDDDDIMMMMTTAATTMNTTAMA